MEVPEDGLRVNTQSPDHRDVNIQAAGKPQFLQVQPEILPLTALCQKKDSVSQNIVFP